jgi:hypothetical protein
MVHRICTGQTMAETPAPRLHVIPARSAPVAAVIARGPTDWFQVLRWDTAAGIVEPGAWLHGTLYPRRCDVSPDGSLLCAFVRASRPPPWDAYFAVSKLPWLTALAAWRIGSTYAAPCQFHPDGALALGLDPDTPPDHGSYAGPMRALTPYPRTDASIWTVANVANELRRGWRPVDAGPAAAAAAAAPVAAAELVIEHPRPGGEASLLLVHGGHRFGGGTVEGVEAHYLVREGGDLRLLEDVIWADWDAAGRLLAATADGALEIRGPSGDERPAWRHQLGERRPDPREAPGWAQRW